MRRRLVVIWVALFCVAAVAVVAAATAALAEAQSPRAWRQQSPHARLQANERAARQDAHALLQALRLPPTDVTAPRTEPGFARSVVGGRASGRYDAGAQLWEVASARPKAILAYLRSHRPWGSTEDTGSGSTSDANTGVSSVDVQFSWPDVRGKLMRRTLTVTVVTPRHGYSVVVARSQSYWFVPRPAGERLPADVHDVLITLRIGNGLPVQTQVHTTDYVVVGAAPVRELIRTIDSLPILQPGTFPLACPLMLTSAQGTGLTLDFKASRHGPTLARVQVGVHRGQSFYDGGGPCSPISLWLGAKQQTPLTSPTFVKQVGRLIGADIS